MKYFGTYKHKIPTQNIINGAYNELPLVLKNSHYMTSNRFLILITSIYENIIKIMKKHIQENVKSIILIQEAIKSKKELAYV